MKPLDSKGRDDYFRRVADVLIAQIKAGTVPWVQSWKAGERGQPYNLKTGKRYRGGKLYVAGHRFPNARLPR